nr:MAG TPA: hypothetical protein [Caudoviricetes sp.]
MQQNQSVTKDKHSQAAIAALHNMRTLLAAKPRIFDEDDKPRLSIRRIASQSPDALALASDAVLNNLVLSASQRESLFVLQEMCHTVIQAIEQINQTTQINELRLPALLYHDIVDYLQRMDILIRAASVSAKRLGFPEPRVDRDRLDWLLNMQRLSDQFETQQKNLATMKQQQIRSMA